LSYDGPTFVAVSGRLREVRHRQRREESEHVCGRFGAAAAPRLPGETFLPAAAASKREYLVVKERGRTRELILIMCDYAKRSSPSRNAPNKSIHDGMRNRKHRDCRQIRDRNAKFAS